jgi:hypothetical protein
LTPKYINIKIPHTSPAAIHTQQKITKLRLKDEIKFLYLKKTTLNKQLYHTHLFLAYEWRNGWYLLAEHRNTKKNIRTLITNFKNAQIITSSNSPPPKFYLRVINDTNIEFSPDELALLSKGLKYNQHAPSLLKQRPPLISSPQTKPSNSIISGNKIKL